MQLYLGYSKVVSADEVIDWLDIDPSHPEGTSIFERLFDCDYIRPGDFEVYGDEDMPLGFSAAELKECFPFKLDGANLLKADLNSATCVFWIKNDSEWSCREAQGLLVTDKVNVERFFFQDGGTD